MLILHLVYLIFLWFDYTLAQSSSIWPSRIPLAVRSPFLNGWLPTKDVPFNSTDVDGVARAPTVWPLFLQGRNLGWAGLIRIDDRDTYLWLGNPALPPLSRSILTNIQITPTRTILSITAGQIDLTATFLSPIETSDPVLQSLPLSYLSLVASSNDGLPHHVQVYADISGEWLSGDSKDIMTWSTHATNTTIFHQLDLQSPVPFSVKTGQSQDASVWHAMLLDAAPSVTYMTDSNVNCRTQFKTTGSLTGSVNTPPKAIYDGGLYNEFAISADLGSVTTPTNPVVWTVGLTRNPAIQYQTPNGSLESRIPYWATKFTTAQDAVGAFVADFPNALQRATDLDQRILSNASAVSSAYADLVSLAARQAMAGTELTVSPNGDGTDVKMFMQDTGASGPNRRVNPVEVMYASFPFFLYLNASYGGYLLEPVLEYANSDAWKFPYAPRDIGLLYPVATGNPASHTQGVEQSGNMLIMALAHARASGDGSLLRNYYGLFQRWAEYLVYHTSPLDGTQTSADTSEARANLTNLAVKGVIGLQAMSVIGHTLQNENDAQRYAGFAAQYASLWNTSALASDGHVLSNFGDPDSSWTIAYNLYADRLLQTNVFDPAVYRAQSAFLETLSTSPHGIAVDTNPPSQANSAWSLHTAAYTQGQDETSLINGIWSLMSNNLSDFGIFPTNYALNGAGGNTIASPAIGGIFAPLALTVQNVSITVPPANPSPSHVPVGAIVGGTIGGVAVICVLLSAVWWYRRRQSSRRSIEEQEKAQYDLVDPEPFTFQTTSFELPRFHTAGDLDDVSATTLPAPPGPSNPPLVPSKLQEHLMLTHQYQSITASRPSMSAYTTSTAPGSSINPPTEVFSELRSTTSLLSPEEVVGLRDEVENLRRVVQAFQTERFDPPPGYDSAALAPSSPAQQEAAALAPLAQQDHAALVPSPSAQQEDAALAPSAQQEGAEVAPSVQQEDAAIAPSAKQDGATSAPSAQQQDYDK